MKILSIFLAVLLTVTMVGAQDTFYPRSANYTTSGWLVGSSGLNVGGGDFVVSSTGVITIANASPITNLNADTVDSQHAIEFANATDLASLIIAAYMNETAINVTAGNVALGQTWQNDSISNLIAGNTAQNITIEQHERDLIDNVSPSISNFGVGQTWQNDSISNLVAGNTDQNITIERHERDLVDNVSPSIIELQGYVPHLIAIAGGAAGDHVVTGVADGDQLGGVLYVVNASPLNTVSDLMAEFTGTGKGITGTDTIANGDGTDTTGGFLIVSWVDKTLA